MVFREKQKLINECPCKLEQVENGTGASVNKNRLCRLVKQ